MKKFFAKPLAAILSGALVLGAAGAIAQDKGAVSVDQLLKLVQQGRTAESQENREREQRFAADKAGQAAELARAKAEFDALENQSAALEKTFNDNEVLIAQKLEQRTEALGSLTELFGHVTAAAGDARSVFEGSIVSAQYPGRNEVMSKLIDKISKSSELPSIAELESMWFEIQREITEQGKVVKFSTKVISPNGDVTDAEVVRVGSFNLLSADGQYLKFDAGSVSELPRQPEGNWNSVAADLASASEGLHSVGIDPTGPSGGSFLAALIDSPTFLERVNQGGTVGYVIMALGALAAVVALLRFVVLMGVGAKVNSQLKSQQANTNNPLGRVLAVYEQNPSADVETLELKLNEAVIKEVPKLESGLNFIKIVATVAPLLGLLGTVTGMIVTFQTITIFGAGDPKSMAGGISMALVTTVQGLVVAIPSVLLHTFVSTRAKKIAQVLEEQASGIIARRAEALSKGK